MNWAMIASLIIEIGLPAARELYNLWKNDEPITEEAWDKLRDMNSVTLADRKARALEALPPTPPTP